MRTIRNAGALVVLAFVLAGEKGAFASSYDPLSSPSGSVKTLDFMARDSSRSRDIPLGVYLPSDPRSAPVILFSHGLGGSRTGSAFLVNIRPRGVMKSRLSVYPALHGAPKYEVVLQNAEHSVFTDRRLPGDQEPRNPNHHRVILALSTAFWDAYLLGNRDALNWLQGTGPRSVLEPQDRWQSSAR